MARRRSEAEDIAERPTRALDRSGGVGEAIVAEGTKLGDAAAGARVVAGGHGQRVDGARVGADATGGARACTSPACLCINARTIAIEADVTLGRVG